MVHVGLCMSDCHVTLLNPIRYQMRKVSSYTALNMVFTWSISMVLTIPYMVLLDQEPGVLYMGGYTHSLGAAVFGPCTPAGVAQVTTRSVLTVFLPMLLILALAVWTKKDIIKQTDMAILMQCEGNSLATSNGDVTGYNSLEVGENEPPNGESSTNGESTSCMEWETAVAYKEPNGELLCGTVCDGNGQAVANVEVCEPHISQNDGQFTHNDTLNHQHEPTDQQHINYVNILTNPDDSIALHVEGITLHEGIENTFCITENMDSASLLNNLESTSSFPEDLSSTSTAPFDSESTSTVIHNMDYSNDEAVQSNENSTITEQQATTPQRSFKVACRNKEICENRQDHHYDIGLMNNMKHDFLTTSEENIHTRATTPDLLSDFNLKDADKPEMEESPEPQSLTITEQLDVEDYISTLIVEVHSQTQSEDATQHNDTTQTDLVTDNKPPKITKESLNMPPGIKMFDNGQLVHQHIDNNKDCTFDNAAFTIDETPLADYIQASRPGSSEKQKHLYKSKSVDSPESSATQSYPPTRQSSQNHGFRRTSSYDSARSRNNPRRSILRRNPQRRSTIRKSVKFASEVEASGKKWDQRKTSSKLKRRKSPHPRKLACLSNIKSSTTTVTVINGNTDTNTTDKKPGDKEDKSPHKTEIGRATMERCNSIQSVSSSDVMLDGPPHHVLSHYLAKVHHDHSRRIIQRIEHQQSLLHLLVVIYVLYLLLITPYYILYVITATYPQSHHAIPHWLPITLQWITYVPSTLKPIVYVIFCDSFREGLFNIILTNKNKI